MSGDEAWRSYASAPPPGTRVCAADAIPEGSAQAVVVTSAAGDFPLLVLRRGGAVLGYVNACPHQYLPLDYRSATILSADGERLLCSAHGAMFDAASGTSLSPCGLDGLDAVPLRERAGAIEIG